MKILRDTIYNHYISIITIAFAILLLLFYYPLTFDFRGIKDDKLVEIYYADNISQAHQVLIDRFNEINIQAAREIIKELLNPELSKLL